RRSLSLPDEVALILGNGSDELLQMLTTVIAKPGAVVLAPAPSFVLYRSFADIANLRFVGVPLRTDLTLDTEAMLAAIAEARPPPAWRRASHTHARAHRVSAARARVARVSEQPDRHPVSGRGDREDHPCGAGRGGRRRGVLRIRRRLLPAPRPRVSQPDRRAHVVESGHGGRAAGLCGRASGVDCRAGEGTAA